MLHTRAFSASSTASPTVAETPSGRMLGGKYISIATFSTESFDELEECSENPGFVPTTTSSVPATDASPPIRTDGLQYSGAMFDVRGKLATVYLQSGGQITVTHTRGGRRQGRRARAGDG